MIKRATLFRWFEASETKECMEGSGQEDRHRTPLRMGHRIPLNDANFHLKVNMLWQETNKKGRK